MNSTLLVTAALLGLIPAVIGKRKGYGFIGWWFAGFVLFIVALPWVLLVERNPDRFQRCPYCREWASAQATACPHCGRDLPPRPVEAPKPARRARNVPDWHVYVFAVTMVLLGVGVVVWALA